MRTVAVSEVGLATLPEELQVAQRAIATEEVQDILKALSKYNLGVCMPHMHQDGAFVALPSGMVEVEKGLQVSFATKSDVEKSSMFPVAWRWEQDGATSVRDCAAISPTRWCHCSG